jgi:hypothetical protein
LYLKKKNSILPGIQGISNCRIIKRKVPGKRINPVNEEMVRRPQEDNSGNPVLISHNGEISLEDRTGLLVLTSHNRKEKHNSPVPPRGQDLREIPMHPVRRTDGRLKAAASAEIKIETETATEDRVLIGETNHRKTIRHHEV